MASRYARYGVAALAAWLWASPAWAAGVTVLHSFNYDDGEYPLGRLLQGSDGRIYGTTYAGGSAGLGTAFAVGMDKTHTILHSFAGSDGNSLDSGMIALADGSLYGTTPQGSLSIGGISSNFGGTVFQITPNGGVATLHKFAGSGVPDGMQPGTLVDGGDGYLYGMARAGAAHGVGGVFKMAADGTLATLFAFNGGNGAYPGGLMTRGSDGDFYGSLSYGTDNNANGALFRISPAGAFTLLHDFAGADGSAPSGGLAELDGEFYGVTGAGGAADAGTLFRMTDTGEVTTLHEFNGVDGASPVGPLALGPDGNLYGMTFGGGASGGGTIFRISPQGKFLTLHLLQPADGTHPAAGPIIGADGLLYGGATQYGGAPGAVGSIFQFDPLAPQPAALGMQKLCYNEFDTCFTPINTWVGQPYSIVWFSANLDSCRASGAWSGAKPPAGRIDITPRLPGIYTYRLRCNGPSGPKSTSVAVTVG